MKTISKISVLLFFIAMAFACKKDDGTTTPTTPDYQLAIEAKYKAIGWDKDGHSPFNGSGIVKTPSGNGYVQYYAFGSRKTAIFYSSKGAFAMDTNEMNKYEALGGDKFAYVVSDPKAPGYNEIIKIADNSNGIIMTAPAGVFVMYGDNYKKYQALNRWDGPLGYPTSDETDGSNTATDKGRFNLYQNGLIVYRVATGSQAVWGKVYKLWKDTDFERGWLKFPTSSCDINKTGDKGQDALFDNGRISISADGTCGNYYGTLGSLRTQTGTVSSTGAYLCYQ